MRLGNAAAAAAAAAASTSRSAQKSEDWPLFVVLYSYVRNVFKLDYSTVSTDMVEYWSMDDVYFRWLLKHHDTLHQTFHLALKAAAATPRSRAVTAPLLSLKGCLTSRSKSRSPLKTSSWDGG